MTVAAVPPVLSVTVTPRLNVPACVGVPAKVRVAALKVMPAGSVPVNVVVYGAMPPLTVSTCAYAVPATAPGSVAGVRVSVGTATTTV